MKKDKIIYWAALVILIAMEGLMPLGTLLFAPQYATAGTKPLGYPDYFAHALIICKVLGVLAIALPTVPARIKEWAYAGLCFNLLFATYSHMMVDKNISFIILPLVVLGILGLAYFYHHKLITRTNP